MTGINYQNKQCFIALQEILPIEKKKKLKDQIKDQLPPFMHKRIEEDLEQLGQSINISTTPEEYESTNIKIGQVVKLDMPTKIGDIIMMEKSEIKLE